MLRLVVTNLMSLTFIELTQPSSEYVVLQAELKRVEQARKLEHDESEAHKQLLEKQLQNEVNPTILSTFMLVPVETFCQRNFPENKRTKFLIV